MNSLRVLLTNNTLANRAGSELYVRDVATALLRAGHAPVAYSPVLGDVADELRAATVPILDDLRLMTVPPDVIHGQHHMETMTALLHFPGVPAVSFCHGWMPWEEAPPLHPRIRRYVAVDRTCLDRLTLECGIPPTLTELHLNFVDLERFPSRPALPARPSRALLFSNNARADTHLPAVTEACARAGIALDVAGLGSGNVAAAPESLLQSYDLVFAKARAALEAMAVGAAVVLCDASGSGPMVSTGSYGTLRELNFGVRTLDQPVTPEALLAQIDLYDPIDAAAVSVEVRSTASLRDALARLVTLYQTIVSEPRAPLDPAVEGAAAAAYLRSWSLKMKGAVLASEANQLRAQILALSQPS
ncbi:MAG: glycosyltransferase [Thermoanaerobaculia bacterium]